MNRLILALIQAVEDAGVRFVSNYPGFHSEEFFTGIGGTTTSVNEKTAFAYAWGSSLAGKRSVVSFKNVGLNDAADAFLGAHFLGLRAGLVLLLFDDCDIQHSQGRIDIRPYFDIYGGIWFEPRSVSEAYMLTRDAFALSESFELPVVIRITNILYDMGDSEPVEAWQRTTSASGQIRPLDRGRDASRFVAHPSQAHDQERRLSEKNQRISVFVDGLYENWDKLEGPPSQIICGAKRGCTDEDALRIFTLPLPEKRLKALYRDFDPGDITVFEHGALPYMRDAVMEAVSAEIPKSRIMRPPEDNRFEYHNSNLMEKLFLPLSTDEDIIVVGDIGSYTMDPHQTVMACLCYGAAIATAIGMADALPDKRIIAVTGDAAYLHSGQNCLWEAAERGLDLSIIILENGGALTTGGQHIPGNLTLHPSQARLREHDFGKMSKEDCCDMIQDLKEPGINIVIIHV